jgi:hypothetical protein
MNQATRIDARIVISIRYQRPASDFAGAFDAKSASSRTFAKSLHVLVAALNDTILSAVIRLMMQSAIWRLEFRG